METIVNKIIEIENDERKKASTYERIVYPSLLQNLLQWIVYIIKK